MSNQNYECHESIGLQALDALSNEALWQSTLTANAARRRAIARLLMHLALIEERRLHLVRGYSSLYDLCVRCLRMSEGQAHRSVSGAHAARSFPPALEMIADGRLHLTGLSLIAKRLTPENHAQLLEDVAGRTKADIDRARALVSETFRISWSRCRAGRALPNKVVWAWTARRVPAWSRCRRSAFSCISAAARS